jgi:hypothetical protein
MAVDTTRQLYEAEATGWRAGLYEDVRATFRAPFVNWIFRTLVANEPALARHLWGRVKPAFDTRAFAAFAVDYRDAVLGALEADGPLPTRRRAALGVSPAEFGELRGQLAAFDAVAPRLSVLFELCDRALSGKPVADRPAEDRAATAPFPDHLDAERGREPTMADAVPDGAEATAAAVRSFHGFEEGPLPSIYRCLLGWPAAAEGLWAALGERFEADGFGAACDRAGELTAGFVRELAYRPGLAPADLERAGFEAAAVEGVGELFREFNAGPVETVLPALPAYAAAVGAGGPRSL